MHDHGLRHEHYVNQASPTGLCYNQKTPIGNHPTTGRVNTYSEQPSIQKLSQHGEHYLFKFCVAASDGWKPHTILKHTSVRGVVGSSLYIAQLRDIQLLASASLNHHTSPNKRLMVQIVKFYAWVSAKPTPHPRNFLVFGLVTQRGMLFLPSAMNDHSARTYNQLVTSPLTQCSPWIDWA